MRGRYTDVAAALLLAQLRATAQRRGECLSERQAAAIAVRELAVPGNSVEAAIDRVRRAYARDRQAYDRAAFPAEQLETTVAATLAQFRALPEAVKSLVRARLN